MIEMSDAKPSDLTIKIPPSNNIWSVLGNNTYDFVDLVSELLDNAVAAKVPGVLLTVKMQVGVSDDRQRTFFVISDDAAGIPTQRLGEAISPAAIQTRGTLNEHGLGMKQAIASLGELAYLATKTELDPEAIIVEKFQWEDITTKSVAVPWAHGTEIKVVKLKPVVPMYSEHYTRDVVEYLGARYRRFLLPDNRQMRLSIELVDADDQEKQVIYSKDIELVKPIYFSPKTRDNKPVVEKLPFKGKGWEAQLTFGYAPTDEEYRELGLTKPTKFQPYKVSQGKQGLDVILHNRVLMFHALSSIGLVDSPHNDYNFVRGEIDLLKGFSTAITKNSIVLDRHFQECTAEIRKYLGEHKLLERKTYVEDLPEVLLRDRLKQWLLDNPIEPKKDVKTEYSVQGLSGWIDVLADGEAWELKKDQADGLDVYQLFAYLDMGNIERGVLVAKSFSTGCESAAQHITETHGKKIKLEKLEKFPITSPMTDAEREIYL
jgi:hypothetical protein